MPDKLCCQKKVFNKHVIIALAVTGVSVTASIYLGKTNGVLWQKKQKQEVKQKTQTDFVIHGEQNTSLDVYVNEMKSEIPQNTNMSEFVCRESRFVLSELVGTVTDIRACFPSKQTNRTVVYAEHKEALDVDKILFASCNFDLSYCNMT